ncbi:MAG: cytochrome o ubiquinol oxidase subunit IV [Gammaproteobacteria bacterium RIFCSPHIGHO2_12_FULL_42_13]|nr:MAG: cytochrome o ubiquinol oxidase subunit IV [Gammaproteobacteria bacterium RIFCSPHIGHO2_12_FULL_42_13]
MTKHPKIRFGAKPKTLKSYFTGLILSLLLTVAAFYIVMKHDMTPTATYLTLAGLAVAQLFAQVICFLRLNTTREGASNTLAFVFSLLVVAVLVVGSLWIMWNLNANMM